MGTAAVGVAQQEDEEQGVDEAPILYRMVFFLAALTRGLFSRVLGADDPSFGPVMGTRGASGAATGATLAGAAASSCGVTTLAASASETPRRRAKALRERAGASPRGRRAVRSTGRSP